MLDSAVNPLSNPIRSLLDFYNIVPFSKNGLDRVAVRDGAVFEYAGTLIDPTTDGTFTYSRSPGGRLVSESDGFTPELAGLTRHGDLAYVFGTTGTVNGTRVFDPFGRITGTTGSFSSNLGFQADFTDPASGETWMGARWYSSADAVFRSRDTVFGELSTPVSLNRYTYGFASPLVFWDPDGRFGQSIDGICSTATSCLSGVTAISGQAGGSGTAGSGVGWSGTQRSEQAFSYAAFMAALGSGANPVPLPGSLGVAAQLTVEVWGFGRLRAEIKYLQGKAVIVPLGFGTAVRNAAVMTQLDAFDPPIEGSTDPSVLAWAGRQLGGARDAIAGLLDEHGPALVASIVVGLACATGPVSCATAATATFGATDRLLHGENPADPEGLTIDLLLGVGLGWLGRYAGFGDDALRFTDDGLQTGATPTPTATNGLADDIMGLSDEYIDITAKGSRVRNVQTNVSRSSFEQQLLDSGFDRTVLASNQNVVAYELDGARYVVRNAATSTGGPTADFYPAGLSEFTLKIRLGG